MSTTFFSTALLNIANTGLQLSAYKAIRDAEQYVNCGWVNDIFRVTLRNSIVIVSCRVGETGVIWYAVLCETVS